MSEARDAAFAAAIPAAWLGVTWRGTGAAERRRLAAVELLPGVRRMVTCARVAWLAVGPGAERAMREQATRLAGMGASPEHREGTAALRRFLEVAAGLDAAVQGERQVGAQLRSVLAEDPALRPLDHVLARLLARGRRAGWQRPQASVASLAARRLGLGPRGTAGVIGDGEMARLAADRLRRDGVRVQVYNRTVRDGVLPLGALVPQDGWIVATAAPHAWLARPPGGLVVDLGQPPQVTGAAGPDVLVLDALLAEGGLRLPAALLALAQAHVDAALAELLARAGHRAAA